jgi:hypothetical protein
MVDVRNYFVTILNELLIYFVGGDCKSLVTPPKSYASGLSDSDVPLRWTQRACFTADCAISRMSRTFFRELNVKGIYGI